MDKKEMKEKRIYMDHAATTALSKGAFEEMLPYFTEEFGNPSAIYSYGQTGKNAIEKCRERAAKALGALKTEIYFTSGGTESDNWAIRGVCRSKKAKGKHIISTMIEHNAVKKTLEQLEEDGYEVTAIEGKYRFDAVIVATGTYLRGKIFIGDFIQESGPDGVFPANKLSECLKKQGISLAICQNSKGEALLKESDVSLYDVDINKALIANHQLCYPCEKPKRRGTFFIGLENGKNFRTLIWRIYPKQCLSQKIKSILHLVGIKKERDIDYGLSVKL